MTQRKRVVIGVGMFLLVLAATFGVRMMVMSNRLESAYSRVGAVDLEQIQDGVYQGSFSDFLVTVELEVTVRAGRIQQIEILRQDSGPGYDAAEVLDRIVEEQTPRVETVSGATGSSRAIITAVHRALSEAQ